MEARAREVMGQMQAEHERLRMQLQMIRAASGRDMLAQGAHGDDSTGEGESQQEGQGGWSAAEMQQQCADTVDLDRMYEELVVADIADEEWWEPAESRPSSGVSDPQPVSPPGQSTEPEPNPEPEPAPEPKLEPPKAAPDGNSPLGPPAPRPLKAPGGPPGGPPAPGPPKAPGGPPAPVPEPAPEPETKAS
eukprot:COSAG01_NODE_13934_length_1516_cov_3.049400_1_plen_191_part_00